MFRKIFNFSNFPLLLYLFIVHSSYAQCPSNTYNGNCSGGNGPLVDNLNANNGNLYWWNGGVGTFNSFNLNGGTLVICSGTVNVSTINFNGGTILVKNGAVLNYNNSLNVNNNCYLINYGIVNISFFMFLQGNPGYVYNYGSGTINVGMATFINNSSVFINEGIFSSNDLVIQTNSSPALCQLAGGATIVQNNFTNNTPNSVTSFGGPSCIYLMNNIFMNQNLTNTNLVYVCDAPGGGYFGAGTFGSATYFPNCNGCSGPLPVTLINMSAYLDKYPVVVWRVAEEYNVQSYVLERSYDGRNWEKISEIPPVAANQSHEKKYQFDDIGFDSNNHAVYYKLSYLDPYHNLRFIDVKHLVLGTIGSIQALVLNKKLNIIVHNPNIYIESVDIFDVKGKKIKNYVRTNIVGLEELSSGFYLVNIRTNTNENLIVKLFNRD